MGSDLDAAEIGSPATKRAAVNIKAASPGTSSVVRPVRLGSLQIKSRGTRNSRKCMRSLGGIWNVWM